MTLLEIQFTASLQLPSADVDGLDDDQLAELIQDRIAHTGAVVICADGPDHLLRAQPRRNEANSTWKPTNA